MDASRPSSEHVTNGNSDTFARSRSRSRAAEPPTKPRLAKADYAIGIALLLIVVFLWTASNFVTQDLFDVGYEKPFLVTYLNTSAFTLYLIPFLIRSYYGGSPVPSIPRGRRTRGGEYEPLAAQDDEANLNDTHSEPQHSGAPLPLTMEETAKLASIFCFFWFIANWSLNAALDYTSVASATILSSMSGFFTLGIGRIFKVEKLTAGKIGAVVTSFVGVILVSVSDHKNEQTSNADLPVHSRAPRPVFGDILALLSAAFYALYVILLKVRIKSESRINMQLFFGFVGLFNMLAGWPVAILLHYTGLEPLEMPSSGKVYAAIFINMAITLSSDYIYVIAMLKTTPLVVTVGLSLTIPLAVVGDFILKKPAHIQVIAGAVLVVLGFIAIGLESPGEGNEDSLEDPSLPDRPDDSYPHTRPLEAVELDTADSPERR
ncbi:hypothetical protein HGRIS_007783 [Hohenbuehelia grisea]|uniref:DUF3955 domain-containing protein n=1 Tax=Hohenbuehelia grisea TaxID=104357 RepID=A0ABR3J6C0_9AGAR